MFALERRNFVGNFLEFEVQFFVVHVKVLLTAFAVILPIEMMKAQTGIPVLVEQRSSVGTWNAERKDRNKSSENKLLVAL
jgi:hypothetical protein